MICGGQYSNTFQSLKTDMIPLEKNEKTKNFVGYIIAF